MQNIGFNSQRDGILPYLSPFQPPSIESFNSQRDGILQDEDKYEIVDGFHVLIPNGMEFYTKGSSFYWWELRVLIPNGMEFYA